MGNYLWSWPAELRIYTLEDYEREKQSDNKNLFFYNINELQDKSWTTVPSDKIEGIFEAFDCER